MSKEDLEAELQYVIDNKLPLKPGVEEQLLAELEDKS